MLILTRKLGETIVIGDKTIRVSVLGIKRSQVRIGVEAAQDIPVHREEIFELIHAKKQSNLGGSNKAYVEE